MKECLKCFASPDAAQLACTAPHCEKAGIPIPKEEVKADSKGRPVCPLCQSRLTVRVCTECGFAVGADDKIQNVVSVSLAGAHGSGKSVALTVMLQQLGGEFCRLYGASLYPTGGDRTISQYERQYYHPLFEQGVCVPSTENDLDPLTYALVFPGENDDAKTTGLAFYDVCGENFLSEQQMARYNQSLYHSGGILFMIDPRQLPVPKEAYKGKKGQVKKPGGKAATADPQALLLRTVHLIRTGLSMDTVGKKISIPIAVCLTKLDTMLPHMDKASFLRDSSRHLRRQALSTADFSSCSLETQSLIENWGGRELIGHVKSQFSDYCFFGFSALGSEPGEQNEIHRIAPHRALDPLLWLLWKNKALRAE